MRVVAMFINLPSKKDSRFRLSVNMCFNFYVAPLIKQSDIIFRLRP